MDWMKSGNDNNFSVTAAKAGRGVAELLVDPISQGFKNDDGSVKTDGLEKIILRMENLRNITIVRRVEVLRMMMALICDLEMNCNPEMINVELTSTFFSLQRFDPSPSPNLISI